VASFTSCNTLGLGTTLLVKTSEIFYSVFGGMVTKHKIPWGIFEKWHVGVPLYEILQIVFFLYPVGTRQPTMYHQNKITLIFDFQ
jgi:hypothetical protein